MTRKTLPCAKCLKINTSNNKICLHVNDIILIGFSFPRGIQICHQNQHVSPSAPPTKNRHIMHVTRKRSKRLRMSQGSKLHTQTLKLRPKAQPAKITNTHMSPEKVSWPRIMQGPTMYAQNCSRLSTGSLKHYLLKSSDTCCM
jgi:hypothetical protein